MIDRNLIPRVLIIDDTYFQRNRIRMVFEGAGFEVSGEADDGLKGVELYKKLKPNLVTMDVNMPFMGGIEAVLEIVGFDPNALIIMVSAMGNPSTIKEAKLAGAQDFVVKPFTSSVLLEKARFVLESKFPDFFSPSEPK